MSRLDSQSNLENWPADKIRQFHKFLFNSLDHLSTYMIHSIGIVLSFQAKSTMFKIERTLFAKYRFSCITWRFVFMLLTLRIDLQFFFTIFKILICLLKKTSDRFFSLNSIFERNLLILNYLIIRIGHIIWRVQLNALLIRVNLQRSSWLLMIDPKMPHFLISLFK